MTTRTRVVMLAGIVILVAAGVASLFTRDHAKLPDTATMGPNPTLPETNKSIIPTVDIAPAKGWQQGQKPSIAKGFSVAAFASDLEHPRWLYVLPNGDVLVAETNGPSRPEDAK